MNDCRTIRETMAAAEDPASNAAAAVKEHLAVCDDCRREFDDVRKILDGADSVRGEMDKVMADIDWDAVSRRIADAAFVPERAKARSGERARVSFWAGLFRPRWRPVFAGVLAGVLVGSAVTFLLLRRGGPGAPPAGTFAASREFLDRVDLELAKRETVDYLEKSEYIILDFIQASAGAPAQSADRIKDLLSKKSYFNSQMGDVRMAKAREICDQIEH